MFYKISIVTLFCLASTLLKSETFLLKPNRFAYFSFDTSEKNFALKDDPDQRNRVYKIELLNHKTAKYYEKSDDKSEFDLISDKAASVYDKTIIYHGEIIRSISVLFVGDDTVSASLFNLEISDNFSYFTKSQGWILGNHIECGKIFDDKNEDVLSSDLIRLLKPNEMLAYAYGAKSKSISKNDVDIIKESTKKANDWNLCVSNCVIIAGTFVGGSTIRNADAIKLREYATRLAGIASEFEKYRDKSEDDGIKSFFRKYAVISSWMAIEYNMLIECIISGDKAKYEISAGKLQELAILKYKTIKPTVDKILSISGSDTNSELKMLLKSWGIINTNESIGIIHDSNQGNTVSKLITKINISEWSALKSESNSSINLRRNNLRKNEKYNQIITIFTLEMTNDQKVGAKLSDSIYLEIFKNLEGTVTVQIRLNKGQYWILSRQTFETEYSDLLSNGEYADSKKTILFAKFLETEINETVSLLNVTF